MIELSAGDWRAGLRPAIGGAIAALTLRGVNVLRTFPAASDRPLDASCFPLVPYCNRVAQARFAFAGRAVELTPNHPGEPHQLHGIGWHRPWQVRESSAAAALLVHAHDGRSEWPWAYRAEQRLALDPAGCGVTLSVTNLSDHAMPAGLGLHPYFRRRADTRVRFAAGALIEVGDDLIPTGVRAAADSLAPWSQGTALPAETVDHCHAEWSSVVRIEDGLGTILVTASHAPHLHVYAPADGSALCFEPVSHLPDALNQGAGELALLEPGASLTLAMRVEATVAKA